MQVYSGCKKKPIQLVKLIPWTRLDTNLHFLNPNLGLLGRPGEHSLYMLELGALQEEALFVTLKTLP